MGVAGLGVVSYGVFDAVNKQKQVSDIPLAIESDQEDVPIEINETSEAEHTPKVLVKPSFEEKIERSETASEEEPKVVQLEVYLDMARVDASGLVTLAGRATKGKTIEVLVGEILIGTIDVGQDGNFASIFELNSSEDIRVLVLRTKTGEEFAYADQSLVILPSQIKGNTLEDNRQVSEGDAIVESSVAAPSVEMSNVDGSTISREQKTTKIEENFNLESKEEGETSDELVAKVLNVEDETVQGLSTAQSMEVLVESQKEVENAELSVETDEVQGQKEVENAELSVEIVEGDDLNFVKSDEDRTDGNENVALDENDEVTPSQSKVVVADSDGVKILQDEQGIYDQLALDSIAYDPFGNVTLGGRSNPSGLVRFYVNNKAISAAKTNEKGYWETDLSDISPGTYTLRIDQLSLKGDVISRLESPFKMEDREKLAKLISPSASRPRINIVTVQPGNTLWAIARKRYGDGLLYVRVFEANRDKIKDPDLIYPGQLFDLPNLN